MFHLAQFTFFVGTVLIMIAGLIMASSVIFGAGAVRFSITVLALGILMIVVTALEGNQSCATPYSSRDACDKEFARLSQAKADEDWGSVLSKKFIIKAFESGVESVIGRK